MVTGPPTATAAAALSARGLIVSHRGADRPALAGIDLELDPGETLLLVGPSGSGKSTLALAIAGLIPGDVPATVEGTLSLDGREVAATPRTEVAARVGLVFQDPAAQLVMERVEDDVAFGLENRGWPREAMVPAVGQALATTGLSGLERRRVRRLSGGQQQRLALAGVLAARPGLLVLDEPTANLDPRGAAAFVDRLREIRAARDTTIVLIEHRVELAWPLADKVLALDGSGRAIDLGSPAEVLGRSRAAMRLAGIWLPDDGVGPVGTRPAGTGPAGTPPPPRDAVLVADDVAFAYDPMTPVLEDVSLTIGAGERVALVGANGGGKSTLARLLVGLLRPRSGRIRLLGDDPARLPPPELARRAAFVAQDPERQVLARTVRDEIMLGLDTAAAARAPDLMERLGLPLGRFGPRSPFRLSGGEARRLSLAVALIREPQVLVLDEPTFGQDRHGYEGLLEILADHVDAGASLVTATHDLRFVRDVATRTVTIERGRIVGDGPVPAPAATGTSIR
jgi:energy-coupling factor transporter ATP-binding protein EcfA2